MNFGYKGDDLFRSFGKMSYVTRCYLCVLLSREKEKNRAKVRKISEKKEKNLRRKGEKENCEREYLA